MDSGLSERGRVGASRQSAMRGHFRAGGGEPHGLAPVTGLTRCLRAPVDGPAGIN